MIAIARPRAVLLTLAIGVAVLGPPGPARAAPPPDGPPSAAEPSKSKKARPAKSSKSNERTKPSVAEPSKSKKARPPKGCPKEMAFVERRFCIDRYEAHLVEITAAGRERAHSPFSPVAGKRVKARSAAGKIPQAYVSRNEAEAACREAGKRLCTDEEWVLACKGKRPTIYPYGEKREPGRCNDRGTSSFNKLYGSDGQPPPQSLYTWDHLNDPRLNRMTGTVAPTGKHARCRNSYGLYDMVGNLHEWTAEPGGTFRGGYYLDVEQNGHGCEYRTRAHNARYRDYSTGFRCCK